MDFPLLKSFNADVIRTYHPVTRDLVMDSASAYGLYVIMNYLPPAGSDFCDASTRSTLKKHLRNMMRQHKGHPALLFWSFGNEENYDGYPLSCWYSLLNEAAGELKAEDSFHPVASANGDIANLGDPGVGSDDASMTNLDIWGGNIYRGGGFSTLWVTYPGLSSKPFWISEHGADAYNTGSASEDQAMQKAEIDPQLDEIFANLAEDSAGGILVAHTAFEFLDEWWKAGNNSTHDNTVSWTNTQYTDNGMQEEWFGVVGIDASGTNRFPRSVTSSFRDSYAVFTAATHLRLMARDFAAAGETILVSVWALDASNRIDRSYSGNVTITITEHGTQSPNSVHLGTSTPIFESGVAYTTLWDTELESVSIDASAPGLSNAPTEVLTIGDLILYGNRYGDGHQSPISYAAGGGDAISIDRLADDIPAGEGDMSLKITYTKSGGGGGFGVVWMEDQDFPLNANPFDTFTFLARSNVAGVSFTIGAIDGTFGAGDIAEKIVTVTTADSWTRFQIRKSDFTINSGAGGDGTMDWGHLVQSFRFVNPSASAVIYLDDIRWTGDSSSTATVVETPVITSLTVSSDTPLRISPPVSFDTTTGRDTVWYSNETQTLTVTVDFTSPNPDSVTFSQAFDSPLQTDASSPFTAVFHIKFRHKTDTIVVATAYDTSGTSDSVLILLRADTLPPDTVLPLSPIGGALAPRTPTFSWSRASDGGIGTAFYLLLVSDSSSFSTILASETTTPPDTQTLLASPLPQGVYYWRVQAADSLGNIAGGPIPFDSFTVDTGPPTAPKPLLPADQFETRSASITFTWSAAADSISSVVTYRLQAARDTVFTLDLIDSSTSSSTTGILVFPAADTWYWRVIAADDAGNTTPSGDSRIIVDTEPPPAPGVVTPTNPTETSSRSLVFSWNAVSDTLTGVGEYRIQTDTAGTFLSLLDDSSTGRNTTGTLTFAANDTFFWRILVSDNVGNTTTTTTSLLIIDTLPPPSSLLLSPTAGTSVLSPVPLQWTAVSDTPSGLAGYRLQVDTTGLFFAPFLDGFQTSVDSTVALSLDTWFWRIITVDDAGNTSASTMESFVVVGTADLVPPDSFTLTAPTNGTETSATTIPLRWTDAFDSNSVSYSVLVDTDMSFPYAVDSKVADTFLTITLSPNDSYLWRVIATDINGNTTPAGDSYFLIDTLPPSGLSLTSPANGESVLSPVDFTWSAASDSFSSSLTYHFQLDTVGTFSPLSTLLDGFQSLPDTTLLLAADTYFWRVIVTDGAGNTDTKGPESFVVVLPPDTTPPGPFLLLSPSDGAETRELQITFRWSEAVDSSSVSYRLLVDTDLFAPFAIDTTLAETNVTVIAGANDTFFWRVIATDASGNTTVAGDSRFLTDILPPLLPEPLTPTGGTTVVAPAFLDWTPSADSGSGLKHYRLLIDTELSFSLPLTADTVFLKPDTFVRLRPDTWFWEIITEDNAGNTSAVFGFFVVSAVDTTPPLLLDSRVSPNSISNSETNTLSFSVSATDSTGVFEILIDLTPLGGGASTPLAKNSDTTWILTFVTDTTVSGGTSSLSVILRDAQGNSDSFSMTVTVLDTSPSLVTISETGLAPYSLSGNAVSVSAGFSDTITKVRFEYRPINGTWVKASSPDNSNPDTTGPFWSFLWDVSSLPDGLYELRAVGTDLFGTVDTNPAPLLVSISNADSVVDGFLTTAGEPATRQRIFPDSSATILLVENFGPSILSLPSGAVADTVWIRMISLADIPDTAPLGTSLSVPVQAVVRKLIREDGARSFQKTLTLTLPYPDTDPENDQVGDSNILEAALAIYHFDEGSNLWIKENSSIVDPVHNTVTATIRHFTLFAVLAATNAAGSLDNVVVYPNPYIPFDNNDRTGRPWSSSDPASGVLFDNLTSQARITVYNLAGKIVSRIEKNSAEGRLHWDVRSDDGRPLASGMYLIVIETDSGERMIKKLMVIR